MRSPRDRPSSIGLALPPYLLNRLEKEPSFADQLKDWLKQIAGRFSPEQEQLAWKTLLSSLE